MKLVDHKLAQLLFRLRRVSPVEDILYHPGMVILFLMSAPDALSRHRPGIGVQKDGVFIKAQPLFRLPGPVDAVGIFKFFDVQPEHDHGIHVPDPIFFRERQDRIRFLLLSVKKQQLTARSFMGMHRKTHACGQRHGSVYMKQAGPHPAAGDLSHGRKRDRHDCRNLCGLRDLCPLFPFFFHSASFLPKRPSPRCAGEPARRASPEFSGPVYHTRPPRAITLPNSPLILPVKWSNSAKM